jgi:hypothetical protein
LFGGAQILKRSLINKLFLHLLPRKSKKVLFAKDGARAAKRGEILFLGDQEMAIFCLLRK